MLTASVTLQGFEAVARRDLKVIDLFCRVDSKKFGSRTALYLVGDAPNRVASEESGRTFVGEALDHDDGAYRITVRMSTQWYWQTVRVGQARWPTRAGVSGRGQLFEPFWSLTIAQSHTRTTAVLVNELDAGYFQGSPDRQVVSSRHGGLIVG